MTYDEMWREIASAYDEGEAKAVARLALETMFGLSKADVFCGKVSELSGEKEERLRTVTHRLASAEPVQYVMGWEEFCGRRFSVRPGVLIPRPETEGLCRWAVETGGERVLDVGTGSGCIAITIASDVPQAHVDAWDISAEALAVARENARSLGVEVCFKQQDALCAPSEDRGLYDLIVSNPPYICDHERSQMARNVLEHEPQQALFVSDDKPLLFYSAIASYALHALNAGGSVLFECNTAHVGDTTDMLQSMGFSDVEARNDLFGRPRFVKGRIL